MTPQEDAMTSDTTRCNYTFWAVEDGREGCDNDAVYAVVVGGQPEEAYGGSDLVVCDDHRQHIQYGESWAAPRLRSGFLLLAHVVEEAA
jgi:hypothetical protein